MVNVDGLMDWIVRACHKVIAACDAVTATTTSVRASAEAILTAAEEARRDRRNAHGEDPIPDDWEQVNAPGGAARQRQRQQQQEPPAAADRDGADNAAADDRISCVICMDPYEDGGDGCSVLPACGHMFHSGCVAAWLRTSRTCPLCRATIQETAPPVAARRAGVV